MSNKPQDQQGIHYHYHFYGPGAAAAGQQGDAGAQQGNPPGGDPRSAGFGPPPFPGAPYPENPFPGGASGNAHAHPGADSLVKGLLIGAGAAYLLTNETAQRTILRAAVQLWAAVQGGVEELKEKLHDAEAEFAAAAGPAPAATAAAAPDAGAAGVEPPAPAQEAPTKETPAQAADRDPAVISPRFFHAGS
ncbi:MAG: hypothetical protein ACOYJQ_11890 [Pseudochelatococcus sp.]|jgi:hypothetical protein|uniref:hypothetical protein n=1 Tax=Pseudochelatococcus sp. TaxID=2020869 RepID=UPI003D946DCE